MSAEPTEPEDGRCPVGRGVAAGRRAWEAGRV